MESESNNNQLTFDHVLEKRIGFGKYQLKTLGVIGFIDFVDGAEFLFITLLVTILKKEWDLSQRQLEVLVSTYFVGGFIGAMFSGIVADSLGRKRALIIGVFLEMIIILYTAFIQNVITMIIVRLIYGFVIGSTLPIGILIVSEQSPNYIRGRAYLSLHFFFLMGKLYLLLLASIFLISLSQGNWRAIALINVGPCFLMFLGTILILDESARYLFINSKYTAAIEIIDQMGKTNQQNPGDYVSLTQTEITSLVNWKESIFQDSYSQYDRFRLLFNERNFGVTWRLWMISVLNSLIGSGTVFLLPFLLDQEQKGIREFVIMTLVQVPALVLVYLLIDNVTIGRKLILNITIFIGLIIYYLIYHYQGSFLIVGISLLKFIGRISGAVFSPMVAESYSTVERSIGIAASSSLGRIISSLAPFILFPIYLKDQYLPFLLYTVLTAITLICTLSYPSDNTGKDMEPNKEQMKFNKGDEGGEEHQENIEHTETRNQQIRSISLQKEDDQQKIALFKIDEASTQDEDESVKQRGDGDSLCEEEHVARRSKDSSDLSEDSKIKQD